MRVVVCIRTPSLKFVGLGIRKIRRTMCVSINGPGDLDLWLFDLETGLRVTRWGTFVPNMSTLGLWVLGVIRYVRDGLTDESKPYCPLPYGRGHNNCNNHDNVDRATHSTTFTS